MAHQLAAAAAPGAGHPDWIIKNAAAGIIGCVECKKPGADLSRECGSAQLKNYSSSLSRHLLLANYFEFCLRWKGEVAERADLSNADLSKQEAAGELITEFPHADPAPPSMRLLSPGRRWKKACAGAPLWKRRCRSSAPRRAVCSSRPKTPSAKTLRHAKPILRLILRGGPVSPRSAAAGGRERCAARRPAPGGGV